MRLVFSHHAFLGTVTGLYMSRAIVHSVPEMLEAARKRRQHAG